MAAATRGRGRRQRRPPRREGGSRRHARTDLHAVRPREQNGPLSLDPGSNGGPHPRDPRPPREASGVPRAWAADGVKGNRTGHEPAEIRFPGNESAGNESGTGSCAVKSRSSVRFHDSVPVLEIFGSGIGQRGRGAAVRSERGCWGRSPGPRPEERAGTACGTRVRGPGNPFPLRSAAGYSRPPRSVRRRAGERRRGARGGRDEGLDLVLSVARALRPRRGTRWEWTREWTRERTNRHGFLGLRRRSRCPSPPEWKCVDRGTGPAVSEDGWANVEGRTIREVGSGLGPRRRASTNSPRHGPTASAVKIGTL